MQNPQQTPSQGYLQNIAPAVSSQGAMQQQTPAQGQPLLQQANVNPNDPREVWPVMQNYLNKVANDQSQGGQIGAEYIYQHIIKPNFESKFGAQLPSTYTGIDPSQLPHPNMNSSQSQSSNNGAQDVGTILSSNPNSSKRNQDQVRRTAQSKLGQYGDMVRQADRLVNSIDYNDFSTPSSLKYKLAIGADNLNLSTDEQKQRIERWRNTRSNAESLFFAWVQAQSGAQVSDAEMERRKQAFLNRDLSPTEAKVETRRIYEETMVNMTAQQAMANRGIEAQNKSFKQGFSAVAGQAQADLTKFLEGFRKANPTQDDINGVKLWRYKRSQDGTYS